MTKKKIIIYLMIVILGLWVEVIYLGLGGIKTQRLINKIVRDFPTSICRIVGGEIKEECIDGSHFCLGSCGPFSCESVEACRIFEDVDNNYSEKTD